MRLFHPTALFCLFAFAVAVHAQAQMAEVPATCPVKADKIKDVTDDQIKYYCQRTTSARAVAEVFPNTFGTLFFCGHAWKHARESGRVIFAVGERQKGFSPKIPETLNQNEAAETAARNLLKLHNYTNISLAATYRSRLKLRHWIGLGKTRVTQVEGDLKIAKARADQETAMYARLNTPVGESYKQKHVEGLTGVIADMKQADACLDQMKAPLDVTFDDWKNVKAELLKTNFEKFSSTPPSNEPESTTNPFSALKTIAPTAKDLQAQQQYVYDVLTDPTKRDWAYNVAEGCMEMKCEDWSPVVNAVKYGGKAMGVIGKTPALGWVVKSIASGLSADLAMRQGLTFWQQVREGLNSVTPFGLDFFDTEIKDIEHGKVKTYTP